MAYEKMKCLYDTERDLVDRLQGTICRYDGKAVRVSVLSKVSLSLSDPVSGKEIVRIKPQDEDFDISSPEIGYMNYLGLVGSSIESGSYFVERNPYKKFRQGLYAECCSAYNIQGDFKSGYSNVMFSDGISGVVDMIEGTYPSFPEAMKSLMTKEKTSVAISKDIAMKIYSSGVIMVYCQCRDVAFIVPGSSRIEMVRDDTSWVIDNMLRRAGIRRID